MISPRMTNHSGWFQSAATARFLLALCVCSLALLHKSHGLSVPSMIPRGRSHGVSMSGRTSVASSLWHSTKSKNNKLFGSNHHQRSSTALFYASKNATTATIADPTLGGSSTTTNLPKTFSKNQEALAKRKFPRTWVPLASVYELDPNRPTPLEFLDQKFVCYKQTTDDSDDDWIVMDDVCPHRLVPLSEGRISRTTCEEQNTTTTTTIQCSYHGWEFDGSQKGACVAIPQASLELEALSKTSPRASVPTYSTRVHKNVLWFWPWADTDPLSLLEVYPKGHPEGIMASIANLPANSDDEDSDSDDETTTTKTVVVNNPNTYTRDLPYGWDTLMENLIDPAHIPFAHHNLQGTRDDAIPIQMTVPESLGEFNNQVNSKSGEAGFMFEWQDRTMGKHRAGTAEFQAPFGIAYEGKYYDTKEEADALWGTHCEQKKNGGIEKTKTADTATANGEEEKERRPFTLGVLCIPTKPGWSRAIILTGGKPKKLEAKIDDLTEEKPKKTKKKAIAKAKKPKTKTKKQKKSLVAIIFGIIPTWAMHLLSNKFLDSDLAFLHYQEQERLRYEASSNTKNGAGSSSSYYYMPAPSDRCIAKLRQWIPKHTDYMGDENRVYELPPPIVDRSKLFDRYLQHTSHCKHCQEGLKFLRTKAKKYTWGGLVASVVASHFLGRRLLGLFAKLLAVACLGILRLLGSLEQAFLVGEFKHYEND